MEIIRGGRQAGACANNESVLSAWYDAYGTEILRYCFMMLGNRTDAEDATQETFLKAWRSIGRFEAKRMLCPYMDYPDCREYLPGLPQKKLV